MSYHFYADDSEFHLKENIKQPDCFLFGGILINTEEDFKMIEILNTHKKEKILWSFLYDDYSIPVKYNFKDLQGYYKELGNLEIYERIKEDYSDFRSKLINDLSTNTEFTILLSAKVNPSPDKKILSKYKQAYQGENFVNLLQRIGLYQKKDNINAKTQIILDWPDRSEYKRFCNEYRSAYYYGKDIHNNIYNSGDLMSIGFKESIYFIPTVYSSILQITDIMIGTFRHFFKTIVNNKKLDNWLKNDLLSIIPKVNGYPTEIFGHGIIISSKKVKHALDFQNRIEQEILKIIDSRNSSEEIFSIS